ncbi:mevalonate kinase [Candidatus Roizmanbacteria bacterium]|nr:mevalonate kinase [Candidatus Roizmanbacteria bacterium]
MKVSVSAPGKLMLFGEHAVVYGYPSVVTAVDKRLYVEAEQTDKEVEEVITPQVKESRFVSESISFFREKFAVKEHVKVRTRGDFSHNVGLGSSSAATVAVLAALGVLFNKFFKKRTLFDMSYQVNIKIQGVGSGFDVAAATFGGTLYFIRQGEVLEPLSVGALPLVIGYSGIKADTPSYVRKVAENFKQKKNETIDIFKKIRDLVELAKQSLLVKDYEMVGKLMTRNHVLLQQLGVSTVKLDSMIDAAFNTGAFGAKLSGAGGGDCMIALVPSEKRKNVEKAIEKAGGQVIKVKNNAEGVKIEERII